MNKLIIILTTILMLTLIGCKHDIKFEELNNTTNSTTFSQDFNKNNYIWENIYFPTNRTSGKQ